MKGLITQACKHAHTGNNAREYYAPMRARTERERERVARMRERQTDRRKNKRVETAKPTDRQKYRYIYRAPTEH